MPTEVWTEWQALWNLDPWGGERTDQRFAVLNQSLWHSVFHAGNRVLAGVSAMFGGDGKDGFDYSLLPTWRDFLPTREGGDDGDETAERPLDPATMSEADWNRMYADINAFGSGVFGMADASVGQIVVQE